LGWFKGARLETGGRIIVQREKMRGDEKGKDVDSWRHVKKEGNSAHLRGLVRERKVEVTSTVEDFGLGRRKVNVSSQAKYKGGNHSPLKTVAGGRREEGWHHFGVSGKKKVEKRRPATQGRGSQQDGPFIESESIHEKGGEGFKLKGFSAN